VNVHLDVTAELHKTLSLLMRPSAVKPFFVSSGFNGGIILNLHWKKFRPRKGGEHHLQRRHSVESRIGIFSQDIDISSLCIKSIRIRMLKQIFRQTFFSKPLVRLV